MGTREGESVQMDTSSQPKKLSSPKSNSRKNAEIVLSVTQNKWWPFERVDGKLLERINKEHLKQNQEEALL